MAPSKKKAVAKHLAGTAKITVAAAAPIALRNGARTTRESGGWLETSHLTELCGLAADHLAMAHEALFEGAEDADEAIAHLDAALNCLKQLDTETARAARSPLVRRHA